MSLVSFSVYFADLFYMSLDTYPAARLDPLGSLCPLLQLSELLLLCLIDIRLGISTSLPSIFWCTFTPFFECAFEVQWCGNLLLMADYDICNFVR